jgi:transcriptional regulator
MPESELDVLRGTLDLLILKGLTWGPRHGYAIADWISEVTDAALLVEEGTLYPALHRLERKGWVQSEWGVSGNNRKAKFYRLSARGRNQLRVEASSWQRYVQAITKALGASAPGTA